MGALASASRPEIVLAVSDSEGLASRSQRLPAYEEETAPIVFSLLTVVFLVVGLVPLVGPLLFFVWSAFALGYSFVAIPSGRMAQRFSKRVSFARRHRGAVFGLGMAVAGATVIPLVSVFLMPLFVVAGTALYVEAGSEKR